LERYPWPTPARSFKAAQSSFLRSSALASFIATLLGRCLPTKPTPNPAQLYPVSFGSLYSFPSTHHHSPKPAEPRRGDVGEGSALSSDHAARRAGQIVMTLLHHLSNLCAPRGVLLESGHRLPHHHVFSRQACTSSLGACTYGRYPMDPWAHWCVPFNTYRHRHRHLLFSQSVSVLRCLRLLT
jgi:hypothetical protein